MKLVFEQKISSIIGESRMEQFNDILVEAFILSSMGLSAVEHFISYAIGTFLYSVTLKALNKFIN